MIEATLTHTLFLGFCFFMLGVLGMVWKQRNFLLLLLSIELMLLGANVNMVAFARHLGDVGGHVFVLLTLAVAAAESAVGLALFVVYFRDQNNLSLSTPVLKG